MEFIRRVELTSEIIPTLLDCSYECIQLAGEQASTNMLINIWKTALKSNIEYKKKLLQMLFDILDNRLYSDNAIWMHEIFKAVYWFFGEYGNLLADETQNTIAQLGKKMNLISMNDNADATNKLLFETLNPSLKAIILRLEQVANFSTWQIGLVALIALGKIGFRCSDPVLLHIYEFIKRVTFNSNTLGSHPTLSNMLHVMEDIYKAKSNFLSVYNSHKDFTVIELTKVYEDHKMLLEEIGVFCTVISKEIPLLPLGSLSLPYIEMARSRMGI